jgi:hypothetical protein
LKLYISLTGRVFARTRHSEELVDDGAQMVIADLILV